MVNSSDDKRIEQDEPGKDLGGMPGATVGETPEETWELRAKSVFDESVARLDGRTRSKLTQARNAALEELRAGAERRRWQRLPAVGLTAAAVAIVAVMVWSGPHIVSPGEIPLEDMDLVAQPGDLEMLQDVEFYAWLGQ